ncbi:glycosyltransferase family 2 protein [Aridibaculum aurantiacum]|uniref:glycosyltransferase family 2 protein n=1 Tax=Aridibaculum aurantiacum TaxID=2810307 RepID=UPI001A976FE0|nr:glycosyltransferase family 2 protein [Aridibaculum aurantiacum]
MKNEFNQEVNNSLPYHTPVSVIILTFNEEKNIVDCLESVKDFTDDIIVVDSGSTDDTLMLVERYTSNIYHHPFENYSKQRNWAIDNVDLKYDWIMNIDADHRLTKEFKSELAGKFRAGIRPGIVGFMASRIGLFMNGYIRHGGNYPVYHGVVFKKGFGQCEDKLYDQHFLINGETEKLNGDIVDIITDSIDTFTFRHNKWATLEARDVMQLMVDADKRIKPNKKGNLMERRRYQRMKYYSYPIFLRVFVYFFYRFILKGGFRDGKPGLIFHVLQGFWFRFLVDAKIYEARMAAAKELKKKKELELN